jgi:hypothetical protein
MRTKHLDVTPVPAWNVVSLRGVPIGTDADPEVVPSRRSEVVLHGERSDEVRRLTGRLEPTMLIWTTIPDGARRMVGYLSRRQLEVLLAEWPA